MSWGHPVESGVCSLHGFGTIELHEGPVGRPGLLCQVQKGPTMTLTNRFPGPIRDSYTR